jgi:hypothetical protein
MWSCGIVVKLFWPYGSILDYTLESFQKRQCWMKFSSGFYRPYCHLSCWSENCKNYLLTVEVFARYGKEYTLMVGNTGTGSSYSIRQERGKSLEENWLTIYARACSVENFGTLLPDVICYTVTLNAWFRNECLNINFDSWTLRSTTLNPINSWSLRCTASSVI